MFMGCGLGKLVFIVLSKELVKMYIIQFSVTHELTFLAFWLTSPEQKKVGLSARSLLLVEHWILPSLFHSYALIFFW